MWRLGSAVAGMRRLAWGGRRRAVTASLDAGGQAVSSRPVGRNAVSNWLFACSGMVAGTIVVGGITRMTKSGLSMVDWKPHGQRPPMSQTEWEAEFDKYKQYPEYQRTNRGMTLGQFKSIYYMEWMHRMLGRAIGVVFAAPFVYFAARGALSKPLTLKLTALLAAGAAQGGIGWWMVKSGLEQPKNHYDEPRVSPYRLAAHLTSAFLIYVGLLHTALSCRATPLFVMSAAPPMFRRSAIAVSKLVFFTAVSGAFVAGNRAGLVYNEFPFMGNGFIPDDIRHPELESQPWRNCFENSSLVQFEHRALAMLTTVSIAGLFLLSRRLPLSSTTKKATSALLGVCAGQVTLGISTLLTFVPTELAAMHQAGSVLLLSSSIVLLRTMRKAYPDTPSN
ncbi:Cytochrome c oxidase assembly protein COX15 [Plasmodiophora brassicae]